MSLLIDEIICHSTWKIANTDSLVISSLDGLMATSDDDYAYLKGEAKKLGVKVSVNKDPYGQGYDTLDYSGDKAAILKLAKISGHDQDITAGPDEGGYRIKVSTEQGEVGNASEDEKNITRALREIFHMKTDQFNSCKKVYDALSFEDKRLLYKNLDPLTQIICIWCCYCVAKVDQEDDNWISDKEWEWLSLYILQGSHVAEDELQTIINKKCWSLARKITNPKLLDDPSSKTEIVANIATGDFGKTFIDPILYEVFKYFENNRQFIKWESAYKALKGNYKELKDLFGAFDVKSLDATYKDLKFNIQETKKAAKLAEQAAIKAQKDAAKAAERKRKEQEREAARLTKDAASQNKLKQHRFKTSKEQTFCQYCGHNSEFFSQTDCDGRVEGHNYVLMKNGDEWVPTCTKCGEDRHFSAYSCS